MHWHEHEGEHEHEHGIWMSYEHEWGFHRQSLGWVPAFARARARSRSMAWAGAVSSVRIGMCVVCMWTSTSVCCCVHLLSRLVEDQILGNIVS